MFVRIIECDRPIKVLSAFCKLTEVQQGSAHEPMRRSLPELWLPASRQVLGTAPAKIAYSIAVECHVVRCPETEKDRKQQQRVFESFSERFSLFDQHTCALGGRLGFGAANPLRCMEGLLGRLEV